MSSTESSTPTISRTWPVPVYRTLCLPRHEAWFAARPSVGGTVARYWLAAADDPLGYLVLDSTRTDPRDRTRPRPLRTCLNGRHPTVLLGSHRNPVRLARVVAACRVAGRGAFRHVPVPTTLTLAVDGLEVHCLDGDPENVDHRNLAYLLPSEAARLRRLLAVPGPAPRGRARVLQELLGRYRGHGPRATNPGYLAEWRRLLRSPG